MKRIIAEVQRKSVPLIPESLATHPSLHQKQKFIIGAELREFYLFIGNSLMIAEQVKNILAMDVNLP